ncbi:MAG: ATP-NAD kinase [Promethearchaeota archaeon]|nr:MAG: ATP-NAD kinase [Candidatus Lokiarchaeota archaeon]
MPDKFTLGLIINPISGMGGSVGLKGTDGRDILEKAINLGATPNALNRTIELLNELKSVKSKLKFITCPKFMGELILKKMDFDCEIIEAPIFNDITEIYDSTAEHTTIAAEIMKSIKDLKLILFVGGDGTARDIVSAIGKEKPSLGIPAGVKVYSSVFSINPRMASSIIIQFLWDEIPLKESEVLDIDEEEYRKGKLVSKLYGYLLTPYNPDYLQYSKIGSPNSDLNNQERIAKRIVESLEKDVYYLIGPGTTTKAITDRLNQKKTVLGIDLLLNNKIIAQDLNEQQILTHIKDKKTKIIVSLIGRQGFLFGRGNLQFSPIILKKIGPQNIIILSTKYKLQNIHNQILRLDTRSAELDEKMRGFYKVLVDYDEIKICKAE